MKLNTFEKLLIILCLINCLSCQKGFKAYIDQLNSINNEFFKEDKSKVRSLPTNFELNSYSVYNQDYGLYAKDIQMAISLTSFLNQEKLLKQIESIIDKDYKTDKLHLRKIDAYALDYEKRIYQILEKLVLFCLGGNLEDFYSEDKGLGSIQLDPCDKKNDYFLKISKEDLEHIKSEHSFEKIFRNESDKDQIKQIIVSDFNPSKYKYKF